MKVVDLYGLLGFRIDKGSEARANKSIDGMKTALVGLGAFFGAKAAGKALIGFNSNVEDTKNKIAGMLALTKKTDLNDQLAVADQLFANLQRRAASLPGTTEEYANMLGMLTQPVTAAGLGLQDLEDITVNAVVAAKAFGVEWEVAARDVDQAIRGQFKSVDQLSSKILGSAGFTGEAGRARFNAMSAKQRAETYKAALGQKQIVQLAERQGQSFGGVLSTLKDAAQQFLGKVGIPLFNALKDAIKSATEWLEKHRKGVEKAATAIGGVLAAAFAVLRAAIGWLLDHGDVLQALLIALGTLLAAFAIQAAAAWIAAAGPIILLVAGITALILIIQDLVRHFTGGQSKIVSAWNSLSSRLRTIIKIIGATLAAPFIGVIAFAVAAKDAIISAFEAAFGWIERKVQWVVEKVEWVKNKLNYLADSISGANVTPEMVEKVRNEGIGALLNPQGLAQTMVPSSAPAAGASNTLTVTAPVTVNAAPGMTEETIGRAAAKEIDNRFRQAADSLFGGRR